MYFLFKTMHEKIFIQDQTQTLENNAIFYEESNQSRIKGSTITSFD